MDESVGAGKKGFRAFTPMLKPLSYIFLHIGCLGPRICQGDVLYSPTESDRLVGVVLSARLVGLVLRLPIES